MSLQCGMNFDELQLTCQGEASSWHRSGELANTIRSFCMFAVHSSSAAVLQLQLADVANQQLFTPFI
jgi:hypothetical protein